MSTQGTRKGVRKSARRKERVASMGSAGSGKAGRPSTMGMQSRVKSLGAAAKDSVTITSVDTHQERYQRPPRPDAKRVLRGCGTNVGWFTTHKVKRYPVAVKVTPGQYDGTLTPGCALLREYPQLAVWGPTKILQDMVDERREYCVYIEKHRPPPGNRRIDPGLFSSDRCVWRKALCYNADRGWSVGSVTLDTRGRMSFGSYNATQRRQDDWREMSRQFRDNGQTPASRGYLLGFSDLLPCGQREESSDEDTESEGEDEEVAISPQATEVREEVELISKDELKKRVRAAARAAVYGTPCTPARIARGVYAAKLEMRSKVCALAMVHEGLTPEEMLDHAVSNIMVPTTRESELGLVDERQYRKMTNVNSLLLSNQVRVTAEERTFSWATAIKLVILNVLLGCVALILGGPLLVILVVVCAAYLIPRRSWSESTYVYKQKLGT